MKSQEVNFQKSQKLLASRAGSSKQTTPVRGLRRGGGGGALTHNVTQVCAAVTTPIFSLLKSLS